MIGGVALPTSPVPPSPSPVPSATPGSTTGQDSSAGILAPAVILLLFYCNIGRKRNDLINETILSMKCHALFFCFTPETQTMHHTRGILVLLIFVTIVCAQTSSNPNGAPFFSPSLVGQLSLDGTMTNSVPLVSPVDYAEFYWGQNAARLSITLNATCDNPIQLMINFAAPNEDPSSSFPCADGYYSCSNSVDDSFTASSSTGAVTRDYTVPQLRPGKNFFITLYQTNPLNNCSYTIQAQTGKKSCPNITALVVDGENEYCANYSTVATNGQSFNGIASSTPESTNVYRIDNPKNVSYVYAWVTSEAVDLMVMAAGGYAPASFPSADFSTNWWNRKPSSNSSLYNYYLEYPVPDGDYPLFISVKSNITEGYEYTISLHWEYCGASKAGYGLFSPNFSDATLVFQEPSCNDPVQFTNMNIGSVQNYTFHVPAANVSAGTPGAAYGFLEIPFGTYGSVNISCSGDASSDYLIYSKNQQADCVSENYLDYVSCNGDGITFLSQDLYGGGYWTVGICTDRNQTVDITLTVSGSVTVPASPSPVPSASTSPGSTTGQDSSTGILAPAVILILIGLAAIIQL